MKSREKVKSRTEDGTALGPGKDWDDSSGANRRQAEHRTMKGRLKGRTGEEVYSEVVRGVQIAGDARLQTVEDDPAARCSQGHGPRSTRPSPSRGSSASESRWQRPAGRSPPKVAIDAAPSRTARTVRPSAATSRAGGGASSSACCPPPVSWARGGAVDRGGEP